MTRQREEDIAVQGDRHSRYSVVAIFLHWAIALGILVMIPLGWWMGDNVANPAKIALVFKAFQLHKSIGLTILVLSLIRLIWRLTHKFPELPPEMPGWEKAAARISHVLLYVLIIAMPLTGWIYVSAGWNAQMNIPFPVPTFWFGLFEWPHLPGIAEAAPETRASVAGTAMAVHSLLAWGAIILVALHAAAALKHHIIDRDDVLTRMVPLLRPRRRA